MDIDLFQHEAILGDALSPDPTEHVEGKATNEASRPALNVICGNGMIIILSYVS